MVNPYVFPFPVHLEMMTMLPLEEAAFGPLLLAIGFTWDGSSQEGEKGRGDKYLPR